MSGLTEARWKVGRRNKIILGRQEACWELGSPDFAPPGLIVSLEKSRRQKCHGPPDNTVRAKDGIPHQAGEAQKSV